jgi:hypothetical protein
MPSRSVRQTQHKRLVQFDKLTGNAVRRKKAIESNRS